MDSITVELELAELIRNSSLEIILTALKDYCETQADEVPISQGDTLWSVADRLGECIELLEEEV